MNSTASGSLVDYFSASAQATGSVFLLSLLGAWTTRTGRLDTASRKCISKLCKDIFLPALLLAKVPTSGLTAATLSTYWVLPAAVFLYGGIGYVLGRGLSKLLCVRQDERSLATAACALPTTTGPVLALFAACLVASNVYDTPE